MHEGSAERSRLYTCLRDVLHDACERHDQAERGVGMEIMKYGLILVGLMAFGWAICVVGLGVMGVL